MSESSSSDGNSDAVQSLANDLLNSYMITVPDTSDLALAVTEAIRQPAFEAYSQAFGENARQLAKQAAAMFASNELFSEILRSQRSQIDEFFKSVGNLLKQAFPPNWAGVKPATSEVIKTIGLDEGIPLAWIPRPTTLQMLFNATNASARRRVIGRHWQSITADCEVALDTVSHLDLTQYVEKALESLRAHRGGHSSASQALSANLVDTMLGHLFEQEILKEVTTNKKSGSRLEVEDLDLYSALTLAPVWCAYVQYWPKRGDAIPRNFARHASAHGVGRRQYSRVNATIALMLVTSILCLLDRNLD